jgi:lysylphosphatidylglycerol synthetase-like protein (DUF2156 family)
MSCTQPDSPTMLRNKTLLWLLILYVLLQLATLFLGIGLFLFVYLIIYLAALIYAAIQTSRAVKQNNSLKPVLPSLVSFFIANLVLFLIYIPTLIYNPNINWKLKGEVEQDPMILQAYVPLAFFCIALIGLLFTALVTKFISSYKTRSVR